MNYMKRSTDKCYLLVSGNKSEQDVFSLKLLLSGNLNIAHLCG